MAFTPTESEKTHAALLQALAVVLFFIPGVAVLRTKRGRLSVYVRYWARVSYVWSVHALLLIVALYVLGRYLQTAQPLFLAVVLHVFMCVMGAFAATFNKPFGYLFIASLFYPNDPLTPGRPHVGSPDVSEES